LTLPTSDGATLNSLTPSDTQSGINLSSDATSPQMPHGIEAAFALFDTAAMARRTDGQQLS